MVTEVILVNEFDEAVGVMEKMAAHEHALLHRAFSVFIFNDDGDMLLQQRAAEKYHSANLWTNACCSHPMPDEDTLHAANRRLFEELGIRTPLKKIFNFTYKASFDNGLTEYEYDHVFIGNYCSSIRPDLKEVQDTRFISVDALKMEMIKEPQKFTAWFHIALPLVDKWLGESEQKS